MVKRDWIFEFRFQRVDAFMLDCGEVYRCECGIVDRGVEAGEVNHECLDVSHIEVMD